MKITGLVLLLALPLVSHSAKSTEPMGTVAGRVTHGSTSEPLENIRVTLEGGPVDPEVVLEVLGSAARAGITLTPPKGASLSQIVTLLTNNAVEQELPVGPSDIQNMVNNALEGNSWPTVVSDRDGRFEFSEVPPGKYTVRAYREGYFGQPIGGVYPPAVAEDLVLDGRESRELQLSMVKGGSVSGRIYDSLGRLLPYVDVQAFTVTYQSGFAVLKSVLRDATDEDGEYRLSWIPPGDYYIAVTPHITRVVTGIQGGKTFYPGVTSVADASIVAIRGGEDRTGMDMGVRTPPSYRLSGEITSFVPPPTDRSGLPLPVRAVLMLVNRDVNTPNEWSGALRVVANVDLTQGSGQFAVNVEPGAYRVFARVVDPGSSQGTAWGSATVDIRDRDVHSLPVAIHRGADVRGFISLSVNARLPKDVRVALLPEGGAAKIPQYQAVSSRTATVGPDGAFLIAGVPAGRFRAGALTGLPPELYVVDIRRDGQSIFDSGFEVGGSTPDPMEIIVGTGAGAVEGIVWKSPLKPAIGATVALIPEEKRRENRALYLSTATDAAGRFKIQGIAPGSYKLFAWENISPNAFLNSGFLSKFEDRGRSIHIDQSLAQVELTQIPTFD